MLELGRLDRRRRLECVLWFGLDWACFHFDGPVQSCSSYSWVEFSGLGAIVQRCMTMTSGEVLARGMARPYKGRSLELYILPDLQDNCSISTDLAQFCFIPTSFVAAVPPP